MQKIEQPVGKQIRRPAIKLRRAPFPHRSKRNRKFNGPCGGTIRPPPAQRRVCRHAHDRRIAGVLGVALVTHRCGHSGNPDLAVAAVEIRFVALRFESGTVLVVIA